ncbi:MAG: hypothetical protein CM1200mP41_24800 [Gammaproteobacteria bacterium]|nr:MAG: hypothetical protein CM1200mP41_24800 [Gammaproteobacteria bacterium]
MEKPLRRYHRLRWHTRSNLHHPKGARVQEIESSAIALGQQQLDCSKHLQALYLKEPSRRKTFARDGEELVEGIQNLQVRYGIDTKNDGFANRYITAQPKGNGFGGTLDAAR